MDEDQNTYVAVFSDLVIRKISPTGKITEVYSSEEHWAPTHGVFDNKGMLWVLECSDKNEIRVKQAGKKTESSVPRAEIPSRSFFYTGIISSVGIILLLVFLKMRKAP